MESWEELGASIEHTPYSSLDFDYEEIPLPYLYDIPANLDGGFGMYGEEYSASSTLAPPWLGSVWNSNVPGTQMDESHHLPVPDLMSMKTTNAGSFELGSPEQTCAECNNIFNRVQLLRPRFKSNNNEFGTIIAPLTHIQQDSVCRTCRFFYDMRWAVDMGTYYLHAFSAIRVLYGKTLVDYNRDTTWTSADHASVDIPYFAVISASRRLSVTRVLQMQTSNSFFAPSTRYPLDIKATEIYARRIEPESLDYGLIKRWMIQCCDERACGAKTGRFKMAVPLYFIDCDSREITRWTSKKRNRYVALSYVWGSTSPVLSDEDHIKRLPTQCPAVIEDAIVVTKGLGIRYLWVDCYCVSRASAVRHEQIARMDLVYKHSEITIIAATGTEADQGLPGVAGKSRRNQPCVRVGHEMFVSTLPSLNWIMDGTAYNTRGWTYQEQFFSYRQLIFTKDQVHFRCPQQVVCESINIVNTTKAHKRLIRARILDDLHDKYLRLSQLPESCLVYHPDGMAEVTKISRWTKLPILTVFEHHVHVFTSRKLSYDSDSLSAIQGILDRFASEFYSIQYICGIPFIPKEDMTYSYKPGTHNTEYEYKFDFLYGLTWTHGPTSRPLKRRKAFPSWSWAGWEGAVSWLIDETRYEELMLGTDLSFQPQYREDVSKGAVIDPARSELVPCSKWRTHRGEQYPSAIRLKQPWTSLRIEKLGTHMSPSNMFYLRPDFNTPASEVAFAKEYTSSMVHLTIPEEDTIDVTQIHCLGTVAAEHPGRGYVYLLLIYRSDDLVDEKHETSISNPYERLGVAVVSQTWYSKQLSRDLDVWLE